jgi:hypothetical protein
MLAHKVLSVLGVREISYIHLAAPIVYLKNDLSMKN